MVAFFVILTFVSLILIDGIVQWSQSGQEARRSAIRRWLPSQLFNVPAGLFHDAAHTWVALTRAGKVRVGVDSFVSYAVGKVDGVELPEPGKEVRRGDILFRLIKEGKELSFVSPVDGQVSAVNRRLETDSGYVEESPYTRGWICTIAPENFSSHIRQLFLGDEVTSFLRREGERLRDFLTNGGSAQPAMGTSLPDGGQLIPGALAQFDKAVWEQFGIQFLSSREKEEVE